MGRHSAPGDAHDVDVDAPDNSVDVLVSDRPDSAALKQIALPSSRGRHASVEPDGPTASETTVIPAIEAPVLEEPVGALADEAVVSEPLGGLDAVLPGVADPGPDADYALADFGDADFADPEFGDADFEAAEPKRKSGGTRADLRLLRNDRTLLARCLAAVIVPFVLYTLVLLVIGKLALYLLLIWIPAILAGVVLGSFLDSAHKRARAEPVLTGR